MDATLRKFAFQIAVSAALAAVSTANAGTYTWIGGNSGTWDKTSPNWNDGTTAGVAWADGNDAVFNNTAAMTISVAGNVSADNILGKSTANISFIGSGTLAWKGWVKTQGHIYFDCKLGDDGNGLHFNCGAHVWLRNSANTHTGGTYIKNDNNTYARAFSLDGGDLALGPVPATPTDNIFALGTRDRNSALFVSNGKNITLHANRKILISNGCALRLAPQGTLRIKGVVHGELSSNGYPTGTRIHSYTYNGWNGRAILDCGDGNRSETGPILVEGNLEIASGTYNPITANSAQTGENAPLYVKGNGSSYSDTVGHLLVSGGTILNSQNSRYMQVDNYGQVDIAGGLVTMNNNAECEYLNALQTPARTILRDGGMLNVSLLRVSQATAGDGGEIFLREGGTLRVTSMTLDYKQTPKGIVHFDGGVLQSRDGKNNTPVVDSPTNAKWDGIEFRVDAGGAVFDTSNGHHVFFGRPLVSGVASGETDGGLTCILANGQAVVLTDSAADSSYTGPTRLEAVGEASTGSRTLQCRVANALPATTTLQIGSRCQAGFNEWQGARNDLEQTVARVEGHGRVFNNSLFAATEAVAPVFDGAYGTLSFEKPCSLSGDFEITGDASGCGCLKFESAGQSIAGLSLKADTTGLSNEKGAKFYKIVDAPKGYTGTFASTNLPENWRVVYEDNAAYLAPVNAFVMVVR